MLAGEFGEPRNGFSTPRYLCFHGFEILRRLLVRARLQAHFLGQQVEGGQRGCQRVDGGGRHSADTD